MKKLITALTAAFFAATGAFAANVTVGTEMGTLVADGTSYTATSLEYKASPSNSSSPFRTQTGWYAGLKLTWEKNKQKTSETNVLVSDNADSINEVEYKASDYTSGNRAPDNSGMKNTTTTSWLTPYMATTEWYVCITPEVMYHLSTTPYSATLTIADKTYTITVPQTIELVDGDGVKWYPALAVVDGKVYGDMGLAVEAGATAAAVGKDMEFFVEPTDCPEGVSAEKVGDVWKLVVSGPTSIESADITLSETEPITFDGKEHTVDVTAVMLGDVALSRDVDYSISGDLSATGIGEYTVTVTGTGNFEGTATATWSIVNTTGTGSTVTESATGSMTASGNDFTLSDSSKLEYDEENGVWYAGITIKWPMTKNNSFSVSGGGYAYYVESAQVTVSAGSVSHDSQSDKFRQSLTSGEKDFTYLATTTWKVGITPEIIAAALAEDKSELVYTMNAGAFIWGNDTQGDPDGVAFQDYTITIPLDENLRLYDQYENQSYPAVAYVAQIGGKKYLSLAEALNVSEGGQTVELIAQDDSEGEIEVAAGVTVALGEFGSANATYVLSTGSVLTSDAECVVSTRETGCGIERSGEGPYTYNVVIVHQHEWQIVAGDSEITATCVAADCTLAQKTLGMRIFIGANREATEDIDCKPYDGDAMSSKAVYDEGFNAAFPSVTAKKSIAKDSTTVAAMKDAGEYVVTMRVSGLGDGQEYVLTRTVTIEQVDISESPLVLTPASTTYTGAEQTVEPSVTVNNLTATFDVAEGSATSATDIGIYTVTVNGTGNFTGSTTATWPIVNTTGSLNGITSAVSGIGDFDSENNTLTISDSTALEYSDGAWYAGLTLTWPMTALNVSLNPLRDGSADYVKPEKMQLTIDGNVYTGSEILSGEAVYSAGKLAAEVSNGTYKYYESLFSQPTKQFEYLATTTWKVALTPAIIEAALANDEAELVYTMNAGAFVWEDGREGNPDGVTFADYAITIPLDEPVEFVLGEGETYDLGETTLTTTKIRLAAGASVRSHVEQTAEGAIYTEVAGYDIVRTEEDGRFVYTAQLTHVHYWSVAVADNGYELVATCANPECDINGGEVKMWLDVGTTEKTYDGASVTRVAVYGDGFKSAYPDAAAVLTVNGIENGVINNAGEYMVALTVSGVGETTYTLSRTVTISPVDITGATLVLSPASTPYTGAEQTVEPSVTVNNLKATFDVAEGSVTSATDIGTYTVTVKGTGNFTGTASSATWSIVNTTGAPTSVSVSVEGSMTNVGNDFTLSDSSKLEYDEEDGVWYAGITIKWPVTTHDGIFSGGYAHYVKPDKKQIECSGGIVQDKTSEGTYKPNALETAKFTYLATTTWKVGVTPAIIAAALAEDKSELVYTMNAGAFIWGNDTEGDPDGVAFADYTITIPLEGIKLYDGDGKQVYPKTAGQTIIDEIKGEIAETVSGEVAAGAAAKIDILAESAGDGKEQEVADWVARMSGETPAEFYAALAQSEYVKASFELDTENLITDGSDVEVAEFEATEDGFALAVAIDGDDIEAVRVKASEIIKTSTDLKSFSTLDKERVEVSEAGKMTVKKGETTREFFMVEIQKDKAE